MQILKALVVIMGVLIIAGFAVLGVELYKRMSDPNRAAAQAIDSERATPSSRDPIDVTLDVPVGSRIAETLVLGNRVLLKVTLPQGLDRLYVVDPRNGAVTATISAGKAAP
ncbi:hypothetical protein D3877_11755 [Azospirillum cavernae]|uniref:Uncharacterized protein n=1 Tax=Azospirillum cavernae TaxID=2320860 RepID=A0A418VUR9_9PROT|nr:hypothetical protein [Azospirillum cavernae]RJF80907.1 hypothetical protein D3877_11755 [Azospirillum cavernae]